jgi:hypothetical protein
MLKRFARKGAKTQRDIKIRISKTHVTNHAINKKTRELLKSRAFNIIDGLVAILPLEKPSCFLQSGLRALLRLLD